MRLLTDLQFLALPSAEFAVIDRGGLISVIILHILSLPTENGECSGSRAVFRTAEPSQVLLHQAIPLPMPGTTKKVDPTLIATQTELPALLFRRTDRGILLPHQTFDLLYITAA